MRETVGPLVMLHTAQSNVDAFERLLSETASDVPAVHILRDDLLNDALAAGELTDDVRAQTANALLAEADKGAGLILCTCSTIGPGADDADQRSNTQGGPPVLRVDRPMAELAVAGGNRVGVAATFETTLKPTMDLIADAARRLERNCDLVPFLFSEARDFFEKGDLDGYLQTVADGLRQAADGVDVIVLAQASMAPALEMAGKLPAPVLTSPRSGIDAAVAAWRRLESQT